MSAKSSVAVDKDRLDRPTLVHVINASDKSAVLRALFADANLAGLAGYRRIADIDVVTAGSQIGACLAAYSNVVGASIV